MYEVELLSNANALLDHFEELYTARYGQKPIILIAAAATTLFKDMARKLGVPRSMKLIELYLKSDGDNGWYKRQAHSMQVLRANLDVLNTKLGSEVKNLAQDSARRAIRLSVSSVCPSCEQRFQLICFDKDIETATGLTICPKCQ